MQDNIPGTFPTQSQVGGFYRGTALMRNCFLVGPHSSLCLEPYGGPRGVEVSYERGAPVGEGVYGQQLVREALLFPIECPLSRSLLLP